MGPLAAILLMLGLALAGSDGGPFLVNIAGGVMVGIAAVIANKLEV